jgi:hypothetical protein
MAADSSSDNFKAYVDSTRPSIGASMASSESAAAVAAAVARLAMWSEHRDRT